MIRIVPELWHPNARKNLPALVSFAKEDERINAANVIYFDKDTNNKPKLVPANCSYGKVDGSFIEIQKANTKVTIITDSTENALSIAKAELPVKILCGMDVKNIQNYTPEEGEKVIICANNDGRQSTTQQTIDSAAKEIHAKGAEVEIHLPSVEGSFNDVLRQNGKDVIVEQITPYISSVLDQSWLEIWNNRDNYHINANALRENPTIEQATALKQQAINKATVEVTKVIEENKDILENIQQFNPKFDIKSLQQELKTISSVNRDEFLQQAQFKEFKKYAVGQMEAIQQEKLKTKSIDELAKVFTKEKEFCFNTDKKYEDLLFDLKHDGYELISQRRAAYEINPNLIAEFTRDAKNAFNWNLDVSKTDVLLEKAKTDSPYTVQSQFFDGCQQHVFKNINRDVATIEKHGCIEKNEVKYNSEKDYLNFAIKEPLLSPYLKDSKFEKRLENVKQLEQQKIQQNIERGRDDGRTI